MNEIDLEERIKKIEQEMKARSYIVAEDLAGSQGDVLAARALAMFCLLHFAESEKDKEAFINKLESYSRDLIVKPRNPKVSAERASQISEDRMLRSLAHTVSQLRQAFKL
ncbi:MAG: hypothetical protein AAFV59_11345 [Pseudomonadota bacterium]